MSDITKKKLRLPAGWLELIINSCEIGGPTSIVCPQEDLHGFLSFPSGVTRILLHGEAVFVLNTVGDLCQQLEAQEAPSDGDDEDPGEPVEDAPVHLGEGHEAAYYFVIRVETPSGDRETVKAFERSIEDVRYPNHAIIPSVVRTSVYAGPTAILHAHVLVIDHDHVGAEGVRQMLQQARRPPYEGLVIYKDARNIGAWHDDHPLNQVATMSSAFEDIFAVKLP
jgi:hypothetical protein